ncbi:MULTISPECIES: TetR/AcrR family transcriptional regulator [Rhodococcus]|jgi:AcrR family transcriptional regulator|uniref:TetR family transcriptional regulator n=1 Tax=Rhodococcus oxybenzonivorans TaxID=1990687 RepID=A0AAE5A8P8_9NOCA|nr:MULTISPECIES: TetR/AcrR family transcriptional regulator [Rhodococcus]MDV7245070.1 TetR family transcriptional regulator [Rhodococcus oxybenzonivorans]MDV7267967.1 TetR family transcriptional regulator [Rhodococcus oxybenzonivorans]MDV7272647.1 TetR family transcriptional regulator [Rhodococcus oxybenzonivorans]MDV7336095.1 TetR family transcriptional regulator [Rhodococcus oxybenzonivorans]MDV7342782.1 TetR family transcriptional regulator [Rhodococcus oxybenzonivorans]
MPIQSLLLDAAEAHFARRGVLETRLSDIRQEVGASVGAVYHHFPNKAELYAQVWLRALTDYQDQFWTALSECADARTGIEGAVVHHLAWVSTHRDRAAILSAPRPPAVDQRVHDKNAAFFRQVTHWWRVHEHYGTVRRLGFDVLYALWLGPAQEYSRHWLAGSMTTEPAAVAPELARAAWMSLRTQE